MPLDYDEISDNENDEIIDNSDNDNDDDDDNDNDNDNDNNNNDNDNNDDPDEDVDDEDDDEDLDPDMDDPIIPGEIKDNQELKNPLNLVDEYLNDSDDEDEYDETYLQKFDANVTQNYMNVNHPEVLTHNFDEVTKMMQIHRDINGNIIDPCHKTLPIMTKFERTRIIGQRAKQIETGSIPFIKVPENIIDSYLIAELELQQRKLPFIIRRPLPNGTCEYWDVNDLEMIHY
jgi:DNA-directed RNA polymerase subunit K/omega